MGMGRTFEDLMDYVPPKKWTPPYVTAKGFSICDFPNCFCPPEARCKRWAIPDESLPFPQNQVRPNGHNYMCRCHECTAHETA